MNVYYVNAIVKQKDGTYPFQIHNTDSVDSYEKAIEIVNTWKKQFLVYSYWITCNGRMIAHECYLDILGNVRY